MKGEEISASTVRLASFAICNSLLLAIVPFLLSSPIAFFLLGLLNLAMVSAVSRSAFGHSGGTGLFQPATTARAKIYKAVALAWTVGGLIGLIGLVGKGTPG